MPVWLRTNPDTGQSTDSYVGPFPDIEPADVFRRMYGFQGALETVADNATITSKPGVTITDPLVYARAQLGVPATATVTATVATHEQRTDNPHNVTPTLIGAAPAVHAHAAHSHIVTDLPPTLEESAEILQVVANHEGLANPHPVYATDTDLSAHVASAGHAAQNDPRLTTFASTSAQSLTGTSLVAITGLSFPVAAGAIYQFRFEVDVTAVGGTTPTHNFQITGPASPTRLSVRRRQMTSATAETLGVVTAFSTGFGAGAVVANTKHVFEGTLVNGSNAGTVGLSVTPGGTTPTSTIGAGSGGSALKVS